jgi:hypothetical protein
MCQDRSLVALGDGFSSLLRLCHSSTCHLGTIVDTGEAWSGCKCIFYQREACGRTDVEGPDASGGWAERRDKGRE